MSPTRQERLAAVDWLTREVLIQSETQAWHSRLRVLADGQPPLDEHDTALCGLIRAAVCRHVHHTPGSGPRIVLWTSLAHEIEQNEQ